MYPSKICPLGSNWQAEMRHAVEYRHGHYEYDIDPETGQMGPRRYVSPTQEAENVVVSRHDFAANLLGFPTISELIDN